ncbi:MAG: dienelactone hydrolase family protein [Arenicellales bacterium]
MKTILNTLVLGLYVLFSATSWAVEGRSVDYDINGALYEGYYVSAGDAAPLVLMMHDWDGLTDYEIKRAHMLADLGYSVFAADLFGAGVRPTENKDKKQHTGELYQDRSKMRALMNGALSKAAELGANKNNTVTMGYCFGGAAVLEMARSGANVKGFATFHGGLKTPSDQNYANAKGSFLIMHGSADTAITMDQFAGLAIELEAANLKHEMVTYSGAPHAFTVFGSKRYRQEADEKSWALFTDYLAKTLR